MPHFRHKGVFRVILNLYGWVLWVKRGPFEVIWSHGLTLAWYDSSSWDSRPIEPSFMIYRLEITGLAWVRRGHRNNYIVVTWRWLIVQVEQNSTNVRRQYNNYETHQTSITIPSESRIKLYWWFDFTRRSYQTKRCAITAERWTKRWAWNCHCHHGFCRFIYEPSRGAKRRLGTMMHDDRAIFQLATDDDMY